MNINKINKEYQKKTSEGLKKAKTTLRKNREQELEQDVKDLQSVGLLQNVETANPAKEILKQKNAITEQAMNVVQLRLTTELLRMTDTLSRKNYDEMADKDFVALLNTVINKVRLMTNLSTQNVAHKHDGGVSLVMPKE